MILNKIVKLDCMGYDKYGRLLCKVILNYNNKEICLNDWMVVNSYGCTYTGDKNQHIQYYDKHYIVSFKCKDGTTI